MDPRAIGGGEAGEASRFTAMTPEERLAVFLELCSLTDSIVRGRPDADRLRAPAPRSPESEALWLKLIEKARRERGSTRR